MARAMPREARLYSLEFDTANAVIAAHPGPCWRGRQGDRPRWDPWRRRRNDPHFEARVQLHPRVARPGSWTTTRTPTSPTSY
jgi:hypothetical protein